MARPTLRWLVVAALLLTGCEAKLYRAETVLKPDGSVGRAIYQPLGDTPEGARHAQLWQQTTHSERIQPSNFKGAIRDLPKLPHNRDRDYFAAWGEFGSAADVPSTFHKKAPSGLPDGKLALDYQRNDLGLLVEHRWNETLTDVVTIDDMHQARRQLADMLIPLVEKFFVEVLGEDYETRNLGEWLRRTGTPWFFELSDAVFELGARKATGDEQQVMAAIIPICKRYGLSLVDAGGKPLEDKAMGDAIATYARKVLGENLQRRDGEKVPEALLDELLEWPQLKDRPADRKDDAHYKKYEDAFENVIDQNYGGTSAFAEEIEPLLVRMLGLYASEILAPSRVFRYELRVPGTIVETNGLILGDGRVLWEFDADEAYPFGYSMKCRSIAVNEDLARLLPNPKLLDDHQRQRRFIELVDGHESLTKTWQACTQQKSLEPFHEAHAKTAAASNDKASFDRVAELLELAPADD